MYQHFSSLQSPGVNGYWIAHFIQEARRQVACESRSAHNIVYGEHLVSFCTCTCAHLLQLDAQRPIFAKGNSRGQSVYLINGVNVLLSLRMRPVI
jgi:hypothetical protein